MKNVQLVALGLIACLLLASSCYDHDAQVSSANIVVTKIPTPYSGNFYDIYFQDSNNGLIVGDFDYNVNRKSVLLRTSDNGNTWAIDSFPVKNFRVVAIGGYKKRIFASVIDNSINPSITHQVLYSDDNGISWKYFIDSDQLPICFNDTTALNVNGHIVSRTSNQGATWTHVFSNDSLGVGGGWLLFGGNTNVYFVGGATFDNVDFGFFFKSADQGNTWSSNLDIPNFSNITNGHFVNDSTGFLFTFNNRLYRTDNAGETFSIINSEIQDSSPGCHFLSTKEGFYSTINSIYHTTDGGKSWRKDFADPSITLVNKIYFVNNNGFCFGKNGILLKITHP